MAKKSGSHRLERLAWIDGGTARDLPLTLSYCPRRAVDCTVVGTTNPDTPETVANAAAVVSRAHRTQRAPTACTMAVSSSDLTRRFCDTGGREQTMVDVGVFLSVFQKGPRTDDDAFRWRDVVKFKISSVIACRIPSAQARCLLPSVVQVLQEHTCHEISDMFSHDADAESNGARFRNISVITPRFWRGSTTR